MFRSSDSEEGQWQAMFVCIPIAVCQKIQCAVLTVCTILMNKRTHSATARRHNEKLVNWNKIVRNLASFNAEQKILMELELELRALDQVIFTSDGSHFNSIEGQAWMNQVFRNN